MRKKKSNNKKTNLKKTEEKIILEKGKKNQNKILKIVIVVALIVILSVILMLIIPKSQKKFEYEGVEFTAVDFCDSGPSSCLRTYQTKIPVKYQGNRANYSFYLHRNPEKTLEKIPFEGELYFKKEMAVDITFNKFCDGFEQIAVANFLNLHRISGMNITGEEKECDLLGDKMYVKIQEANRTFIEKTGPACYNINIKECEILDGTERFMIESFVEIKKIT